MKYKYSRKEWLNLLCKDSKTVVGNKDVKDLLAKKNKSVEGACCCCGSLIKISTPSPLEIEEIPEIKRMIIYPDICEDLAKVVKEIVENQSSLISNQKKLYQYIKEKI